jgi:3-isopropylmalate/(R)-2-methylmalate dehydratase large subunit
MAGWMELKTDQGAKFDKAHSFDASQITPMITWGTNPGMSISIDQAIPSPNNKDGSVNKEYVAAQKYMGLSENHDIAGLKIDYVFVGSCTNGRIEDLREFASIVSGKKKADHIVAWIVPGSQQVMKQAQAEGLEEILNKAGFELREPGCSACLAMNEDKVPAGKYCVSTSNRNFEGRQGPGSRTLLASPATAAKAAIAGSIVL